MWSSLDNIYKVLPILDPAMKPIPITRLIGISTDLNFRKFTEVLLFAFWISKKNNNKIKLFENRFLNKSFTFNNI